MRISKLMGLAVSVVALAVTINALAYQTAVVTNGMTITVDNSSAAQLAIDAPTDLDPGITTAEVAGKFSFTVADVMQPDSVYTFHNAFKVTNNAGHSINLSCSPTGLDSAISIVLRDAAPPNNSVPCDNVGVIAIAAAGTKEFRLQVTVASSFTPGSLGDVVGGSLVLTGTR
jgi:hypothetical protein